MALADDIQALTTRTLSALEASHDYYTYTKRVWRLLQRIVKEGRKFTFRNLTTATRVDEQVLLGRAQLYVFAYLERLTNLGCATAEEIEKLAEIKASRDILVHNNGIANATYVSKAGTRARYNDGDKLEIPEQYHRASWETISKVVRDVSAAAP